MDNYTFNLLWAEVQNGSEAAFAQLYEQTIGPLSNLAYKILKDREAVRDLLQEVFVELYFGKDRIGADVNIVGYLHSMVKFKALNIVRDQLREKMRLADFSLLINEAGDKPAAEERGISDERLDRVPEYIQLLPEKCRKVFLLKFYNNLTYKQISSQLGISVKTVENHITKAFAILRHKAGEERVFWLLLALGLGIILASGFAV